MSAVPVYRGKFGAAEAERLLSRAGFGPRPGEAKELAKKGLAGAVRRLTHPPAEKLTGPEPRDERGEALAPADAVGHDHLWWLDRMVRTNRPLVERMTLIWHDWFATSNQGVKSQRQMLDQNALFRKHSLGSFEKLLLDVTKDPAMLVWLSGNLNSKTAPNENYGRELMELFTLGADRPGGYSEQDVREQARALTGWTNRRSRALGNYDFRYDPSRHDDGTKSIFGKSGAYEWEDSCRLCLRAPQSPLVLRAQALGLFHPRRAEPLDPVQAAEAVHGEVRGAARRHRDPQAPGALHRAAHGQVSGRLHRRPAARHRARDRPPAVVPAVRPRRPASLLPAERRGLGRDALARHRDVSGALEPGRLRAQAVGARSEPRHRPAERERRCLRAPRPSSGTPPLTQATRRVLLDFARRTLAGATDAGAPVMVENALRQLIAISPEVQAG